MTENINFYRIEKAIRYLIENYKNQPSLDEIAQELDLSPYHFQRLFTEWAGVSPKKFLQYLTIEELKHDLHHTSNLIDAAEKVGLSSQSRVYDLFVSIEAVTPQEYKSKGEGLEIDYGIHTTPFGDCFIAITKRGICSMSFVTALIDNLIDELKEKWNNAELKKNQLLTKTLVDNIFNNNVIDRKFKLHILGTKFQVKVWEALLKIPFASVSSYQQIAYSIGNTAATRAVGSAIAQNPVAYLIPCHRVIRSEGIIGNYHWGDLRKTAIIGWEKAQAEAVHVE